MKAQELIDDVRTELVETVAAFWTDAELLKLLNRGEKDFVNKTRILESRATMPTQVGILNYPLPSNWLSDKGTTYTVVVGGVTTASRLRPTNLEKMLQQQPNFQSPDANTFGTPENYFIWGKELWMNRAPDAVATLTLFYKSKPIAITAPITTDLNVDDSLSDAIHHFMLWKAWSKEKEFDLATAAEQEYMRYVGEGRKFVKKQSGDQTFSLDIESGMPITGTNNTFPIR